MAPFNPNNFPIDSLPPLTKSTVLEVEGNTHFALSLIAASSFGAISTTSQNTIDVLIPLGSVVPTSLFFFTLGESGVGKTTVDGFFTKPNRVFEESEDRKTELMSSQIMASRETRKIEVEEIKNAIKKNRRRRFSSNCSEEIASLDDEFEKLQNELQNHIAKEPPPSRIYNPIKNNITIPKLLLDLHREWPSACYLSDEGDSFLRGDAMQYLPQLCQLWDGTTVPVGRISSPSFKLKNTRLTVSIMVQPGCFQDFLARRGKKARDQGFLARCLISFPESTQGSRYLNNKPPSWKYLTTFQQRVTEILTEDKLAVEAGRQSRKILEFTPEANHIWFRFHDQIEYDLNAGRCFFDIRDAASKAPTNAARLAALLHFFEGLEGDISAETLQSAIDICVWYLNEFKRLFTKHPELPLWVSDAIELEKSLVQWCQNNTGQAMILKSALAQYGPYHLRKNGGRRDDALHQLVTDNKVQITQIDRKQWVVFNPNYFPVPAINFMLFQKPIQTPLSLTSIPKLNY